MSKDPKHCYAVLAHQDIDSLNVLLELLDDERNDIYIHIDKKTPVDFGKDLKCNKANLFIIPVEKRVDIRWGDISVVEAELVLFDYILSNNTGYSYIHLISGQDLPLKNQNEIHEFFNKFPKDSNFIELSVGEQSDRILEKATGHYYLFTNHQRPVGNKIIASPRLFLARVVRHLFLKVQKLTGYKRKWKNLTLSRGSNWASISIPFAKYLTDQKDAILRRFKGVLCADEIYLQTYILNSPYESTLKCTSRGNTKRIRKIDWSKGVTTGSPHTWTLENWDELKEAPELFARKFSTSVDPEIIYKVRDMVKNS